MLISNAQYSLFRSDVGDKQMHVAFINSMGFGGNNATAVVLSPQQVEIMLTARYDKQQIADYKAKRDITRDAAEAYANRADIAELDVIYRFGEALVDEDRVMITEQGISVPGYAREIEFDLDNPHSDMQ